MPVVKDEIKRAENEKLIANPKVRAMLNTIAYAEGADYNTRVGGSTFEDLSKKPGKSTYIKSIGDYSTAEGRYQFLNKTWQGVAKDLGLTDFSPRSQVIAAVELIRRRGALDDVLSGNFNNAVTKLSGEWASLPTKSGKSAYSNQRARSIEKLRGVFEGAAGESSYTPYTPSTTEFTPPIHISEFVNYGDTTYNNTQEKDTEEVATAKQEIDKATTDKEMLQNFFAAQTAPTQQQEQPQYQPQQQEQSLFPSLEEQYAQVSQLVDNPLAQEGSTVGATKDWLQNWYTNRVLPDAELNQIYQQEKPLYVQASKNLPDPTYVDKIDEQGTKGLYEDGTIKLIKSADPFVYTHEGSHDINKTLKDTQSSWKAFEEVGKNILPKEKIQDQWVKDNYEYLNNYQEVIGRINAYRQMHDLKPDQKITPELIKKNRELYKEGKIPFEDNTDQLYKLFEDEGLSNILNKVVYSGNSSEARYAQEGGIPISSRGVYDYPMQEVIVPTKNGRITMKDVNYPILGIDEHGNSQMMYPGQDYNFPGKNIHEIPQLKKYFNKR